jgi:hypothetical protein
MPGHIKMGAPGALQDYMVVNLDLYSKSPANQFAAKLATGAGNYDDLQNWSYLVMDNWQAGVGQKDVEAGGFLYSELETRYPERIALPTALSQVVAENVAFPLNYGYQAGADLQPTGTLAVGTTQSVQRIEHAFNGSPATVVTFTLYLPNDGPQTTVALYSSAVSGGNQIPNASVTSTTVTPSGRPGHSLYSITFTGQTISAATYYHLVVHPTVAGTTLTLPVNTTDVLSTAFFSTYNGSAWANYTANSFLHAVEVHTSGTSGNIQALTYFPTTGKLYGISNDTLVSWSGTVWASVGSLGTTGTSLLVVGNELWIGCGNSAVYNIMDSAEVLSAAAVSANLLASANGYVWRSVSGDVYYTDDGATWVGPIQVAWDGHQVRGMASQGDYLYCSTDDGLYYIGYGDFVFSVAKWPSVNSTNGRRMINHQGSLFIPMQQSIMRFDGSSMMPIGMDMGEGLPANRVGIVIGLQSLNNWLVATLEHTELLNHRASVWAYNDQGWHALGELPLNLNAEGGMAYSVATRRLYIGSTYGTVWEIPIADSANYNYITGLSMPKASNGWMETDWFFGGLKEVDKDFESVYISGENFSATLYAKVYWQDDDSTDWELLGTVTADRTELRWDDYDTRPNTRQLKLGILLVTASAEEEDTPIIRAVRIKYHPMVSDWFRWSFPILVSDNQQELGGTLSTYTADQKRTHLDSLITQVAPFILEDMGGTQYEVKVMGCQIQHTNVEWINGAVRFNSIYNMTLEQIRNGVYTA